MKHPHSLLLLLLFCFLNSLNAQESEDYIEFNDRKNTVHGVYLGLGLNFGFIDKAETFSSSFKVAYVANQQFEIGFIAVGLYSDLNRSGLDNIEKDLGGVYGGLHLEPILFSKSKINLSFPLLIGGGTVVLFDDDWDDDDWDNNEWNDDDWEPVFVVEPGVNILYNINRYIQLEAGIKYRFSSKLDFNPEYDLNRINGISGGIGLKVGVFNMGRNRYKKNIKDGI
ncbi:hypothetical protein Q4Q35_16655 [Flavivirga aquimarina]|uniref:Outer membrane protein beta-barrel domain-containing protein n=1 Tax=Flavivirga aquimarina TaxID=2027862 RepID=A0ABT8WEI4_9FLAO|nr:hypothetical protein [Flavivirga aquimarina]MDO5971439.1 hypothetical protein [Flavivirga aquimarina]